MNQETRNKKNRKYSENLQKRGITLAQKYAIVCSDGIKLSDNIVPLKHEFVLTKRHGKVGSREVFKFEWSKQAKDIRKEYHDTKNGVTVNKPKLKKKEEKKSKEERLESREYSDLHKKLVNKLYAGNNGERIFRQQANKAAHEAKIKEIQEKLENNKLSRKLHYTKQRPYKIVISTKQDPNFNVSWTRTPLKTLEVTIPKLNERLKKTLENYKEIKVVNTQTDAVAIFCNGNKKAA